MSYRVLLPVVDNPAQITQVVAALPDLTRLILVNNWVNPEVRELCRQLADQGAEVYDCPWNFGTAPSWNLGMRRIMETGDEAVIILSPSICFDQPFAQLLDILERTQFQHTRYVFDSVASLHCFGVTRKAVELGGYFDENFWPCYYEDIDYCRRSTLNGLDQLVFEQQPAGLVHSLTIGLSVRNPAIMDLYQRNIGRMHEYYLAKWGGWQLSEVYPTPFNDPQQAVNHWVHRPPYITDRVPEAEQATWHPPLQPPRLEP